MDSDRQVVHNFILLGNANNNIITILQAAKTASNKLIRQIGFYVSSSKNRKARRKVVDQLNLTRCSSTITKFMPTCSYRSFTRCRNWIRWLRCNSSVSRPKCFWVKTSQRDSSSNSSSNSAITRLKYKYRASSTRWFSTKVCMATTWSWFRISRHQNRDWMTVTSRDILRVAQVFQTFSNNSKTNMTATLSTSRLSRGTHCHQVAVMDSSLLREHWGKYQLTKMQRMM